MLHFTFLGAFAFCIVRRYPVNASYASKDLAIPDFEKSCHSWPFLADGRDG